MKKISLILSLLFLSVILTACGNNEKIVMMLSEAVIQTNKMKTMISVRNDNLQNKVKQKGSVVTSRFNG
ncbi:hypothetical protein AZH47_00650 [Corynebacterium striatum]|nr:hypothetical protein AZH47_00650 [Corynebacterium striatum]